MKTRLPILLSFYALSNGSGTLIFGQLTYTKIKDLSFKDYSRRRTFRTLYRLYHTKPYADQYIVLFFDDVKVHLKTDAFGSFNGKALSDLKGQQLRKIVLVSGSEVTIPEGLYPLAVDHVENDVIVISDIDDTLMHSYIYRKILKFKTLMFTAMEKRRAVAQMQELIFKLSRHGAAAFYLSNSEQNLHPLIYRFLVHNHFPTGPIFLKKMRRLWDVIFNIKFPLRNVHKEQSIVNILAMFPEKKFVLIGDNSQYDLSIYLQAAEKYPQSIRYILIRKVIERKQDLELISKHDRLLKDNGILLYYENEFSFDFKF